MITNRIALALALTAALSMGSGVARAGTPAAPVERKAAEPHPEINRAIVALSKARWHLQHAAHDFGGHRAAALVAVDGALEQLKLALQYDR